MTLYDLREKKLYVGGKQVVNIYLGSTGATKPKRYSPSLISPEAQLHEFDYMSPHGQKLPDTVHTGTYSKNGYMQNKFQMNLNGTTGVTSRPRVGNTIVYEYILSRNVSSPLSSIMYLNYDVGAVQAINIIQTSQTVKGGYAFSSKFYGEPTVTPTSEDKFFILHFVQRVTDSSNTTVTFYINGKPIHSGSIGITSGVAFQRPLINASGGESTGVITSMKQSYTYNAYLKEVAAYDFGGIDATSATSNATSLIEMNYQRAKELYN